MKHFQRVKHVTWVAALIALMAINASSCKKVTYYKLSDEDMSWLVYDDHETIKYRNATGVQRTFHVTVRLKGYEQDGNKYKERTYATMSLEGDTIGAAADRKGLLDIFKSENGLLVSFTWPHFPITSYPLNSASQQIMSLGGITYLDIIEIDGTLLADQYRYVTKVWYSKSEGVVQYEDINGNTWNKSI